MNTRDIRFIATSRLLAAGAAATVLTLVGCVKDPTVAKSGTSTRIGFDVSMTDTWNQAQQSRSEVSGDMVGDSDTGGEEPVGVYELRDEESDEVLYLHVSASDWEVEPDSVRSVEVPATRDVLYGKYTGLITSMEDFRTIHGKFYALAYSYEGTWAEKGATATPNLMYNEQISVSTPVTDVLWPGSDKNVRFFAFAPLRSGNTDWEISGQNQTGTPSLDYAMQWQTALAEDLLYAVSDEVPGDGSGGKVSLQFKHALAHVKFELGEDLQNVNGHDYEAPQGQLYILGLDGLYLSGTFNFTDDPETMWTLPASKDESSYLSVSHSKPDLTNDALNEIDKKAPVLLIPQTLGEDAVLSFSFNDSRLNGLQRDMKAKLANLKLEAGKKYTFKITTSAIEYEYDFSTNAQFGDDGFTMNSGYGGYEFKMNLTSSSRSRYWDAFNNQYQPGAVYPEAVDWTYRFVRKLDSGEYEDIPEADWPQWVKVERTLYSGDQSLAGRSDVTVTVAAQELTVENPHNDKLREASPVSDYDLSTKGGTTAMNTANCYIINAPGTYRLPLIYGNCIKNDAANLPNSPNHPSYYFSFNGEYFQDEFAYEWIRYNFKDANGEVFSKPSITRAEDGQLEGSYEAVLVWQDADGLVKVNSDIVASGSYDYLTFEVPQSSIAQGNAVVAVKDASGKILWSWHIWVTDMNPDTDAVEVTNRGYLVFNQPSTIKMLPINLGYCYADAVSCEKRSALLMFEQKGSGKRLVYTLNQDGYSSHPVGNMTYYQYGRKDPVQPYDFGTRKLKTLYYDNPSYAFTFDNMQGTTLAGAIQHPYICYQGGTKPTGLDDTHLYDWWLTEVLPAYICKVQYPKGEFGNPDEYIQSPNYYDYLLWGDDRPGGPGGPSASDKTVYDPSPVGYRVPRDILPFTGFGIGDGHNTATFQDFRIYYVSDHTLNIANEDSYEADRGYLFYCQPSADDKNPYGSGDTIFFPFAGYYISGSFREVAGGGNGNYSIALGSSAFYCSSSWVRFTGYSSTTTYNYSNDAYPVRAVAE